jgi:hypothetical protein
VTALEISVLRKDCSMGAGLVSYVDDVSLSAKLVGAIAVP